MMLSRYSRVNQSERSAFTLIELLVVVVIMLTLVAISLPLAKKILEDSHTREASRQLNGYFAMAKINAGPTMSKLPLGVSNAPFGDEEWQAEMMQGFLIALLSGVLLVFAVLVLLYRRFMSPLVNMASLLLAPLGGLLALAILGQPLSLPVFIGVLMLFGIVAKNSILLVDFAVEMMDHGMPKAEALMEAGHKRAQPIVMTTVAMVAGMIPTAISLSGDAAWRAPMGTVVIGGLILSTLLTLLIVPAGFSLADGLEKRLGPWLRDRLLTYEVSHSSPDSATPLPAE